MRKIILFAMAIAISSFVFGQNRFKYSKIENNKYETVFTVLGIYDKATANQFINKLIETDNVIDGKIFYNRRCKITSKKELYFEQIRQIAQEFNADFQLGYCVIKDKRTYAEIAEFSENYKISDYTPQIIPASEWVFPADFPKKEKYTNAEDLKKAKQQWIEDNPYKWRDITGLEYLDFSINLNFKTK